MSQVQFRGEGALGRKRDMVTELKDRAAACGDRIKGRKYALLFVGNDALTTFFTTELRGLPQKNQLTDTIPQSLT